MRDDLWERISQLEDELLAEEEEDEYDEFEEDPAEEYDEDDLMPGRNYAVDFRRAVYEDEEYDDSAYMEPPKKKGIKGLVLLALLELLGIGIIIAWWLQWMV